MTEPKYHAPSANLTFETPVTKFLSPAALAAYNSFHEAEDGEYVDGVWVTYSSRMIAAALRAVADEVTPHMFLKPQENLNSGRDAMIWGMDQQTQLTRQKIRAIASELEEFQ